MIFTNRFSFARNVSDLEFNPIVQKLAEMFPLICHANYGERSEPLNDREPQGYIGMRKSLFQLVGSDRRRSDPVLSVSIYIREINCFDMSVHGFLANLCSYCLYRKAIRKLGLSR